MSEADGHAACGARELEASAGGGEHERLTEVMPADEFKLVEAAMKVLDDYKPHRALKRMLKQRVARQVKRQRALADPFVGTWGDSELNALVMLPIDPIPAHLIIHPGFCKDRENRATWPSTWKGDGVWCALMSKATGSTRSAWKKWENFIGSPLPWPLDNAPFAKSAIIGILFLQKPVAVTKDCSMWRDPEYGVAAFRIAKCLAFDAPVYGCDLPQGYTTRIFNLKNSAVIVKHLTNRLRGGHYKWLWTSLDKNGIANPETRDACTEIV